ncbi:hypothetical protein REPUB_Repub17cG0072600 [Reevesia pubescens]
MDVRAFPGPSRKRILDSFYTSSDDEDSQEGNRPSSDKGKGAIAASSVELKTYERRNIPSAFVASSAELKTYERRNRSSANKGKAIADSSVELKTNKRRISDYQKLQCANNYCKAAYLEVMRLAKEADTWVRMKPGLGYLDDFVSEFRTPALPGKKLEISVATAVIPNISASAMANMMISKNWSKSLFPFINHGEGKNPNRILQLLSNTDTAIKGVVQLYVELQLPTTLVPTRYVDFLRYGKEIMEGVYIIVDFSSLYLIDSTTSNCQKRPSGVIIREHGPQDCEIICVENMEVYEPKDNIYSSITNSNLAFCANRWISTLLWNLNRDSSRFVDVKMDVHGRAGSFLLALTNSMKHFFMECVSQHPEGAMLSVLTSGEDPIRLLHNKTLEEYFGYVGLKSFRIQAKPLSVFQFLMKKDIQLQFRSSENSVTDEEVEQLFKFATDDKSNIISLHRKKMQEETRYCLQEASRDEYCSFIISKIIVEDDVDTHIVSGVESIQEQSEARLADITTSGFSIMPDGSGGLQCNGSLVTVLMQLQYDRTATATPVVLDSVRDDFLDDLNDIINELNEEGKFLTYRALISQCAIGAFSESDQSTDDAVSSDESDQFDYLALKAEVAL